MIRCPVCGTLIYFSTEEYEEIKTCFVCNTAINVGTIKRIFKEVLNANQTVYSLSSASRVKMEWLEKDIQLENN